ncbi:MAG TPA: hypothetical protein VGI10_13350, partial [Polyangiaceae bacterium]|jgi:hypothetical protein
MRILIACIPVVLSFGLMAASTSCSSTSSDAGAGGTSGGTSGAGGDTTAGTGGGAVDAGTLCDNSTSDACTTCNMTKCTDSYGMCTGDTTSGGCRDSLVAQGACLCADPPPDPTTCTSAFSATSTMAKALADCVTANCKSDCGL